MSTAGLMDLPDRTPPSKASRYTGKRLLKHCTQCGGPFLIANTYAPAYQTCSRACTFTLHSRQRRERQQGQPHPHRGSPRLCKGPARP